MSIEENKAVVRRFNEALHPDIASIAALLAPDFKAHLPSAPKPLGGRSYTQGIAAFNAAFPDARLTEQDLISEGEKVVTRWTLHGTHQGDYQGLPATGRSVALTGITVDRIKGGQVVEHWVELDLLGLLQQLGTVPAPKE